jgi:hypothetical protein
MTGEKKDAKKIELQVFKPEHHQKRREYAHFWGIICAVRNASKRRLIN